MGKFFRFYVKDQNGHIEMEIGYYKYDDFTVRFPRYVNGADTIVRPNRGYVIMSRQQLAMLIFAYSESEYFRFVEELEKFYKELGENE